MLKCFGGNECSHGLQSAGFSFGLREQKGRQVEACPTQTMTKGMQARLQQLGLVLPALPAVGGNYLPAKTVGNIVYLAGVISTNSEGVITGTVGIDRTIEEGYAAARACALTQLAVLQRHLGSLDAVKSIVSVNGYVNAVAGFQDSPKVVNGASDLFVEIFGEAGRHVRAAIGVSALPRNALVELQMTVELERA
jgi:enamine deaminase RidA (YjgF/YER057c/UK114 family)